MQNSHKFFRNIDCKYFPCHKTNDPEKFNCLFCFCPLYLLGDQCGGNFRFVGENHKIKDCTACALPHHPDYYDVILRRLREAQEKKMVSVNSGTELSGNSGSEKK